MPFAKRLFFAALPLLMSIASTSCSAAPAAAPAATPKASTAVATFAGGCFWSEEVTFEGRPGVISVTSGYTGGTLKNPTYEDVGTRTTGHYESVNIIYDPAKTTYEKLLDIYWHNIDPMQADGAFCDHGPEYHSAIFYHDETQHRLALETEKQIEASGKLPKPIVTQILPAKEFYPAEEYHQDFYKKNPDYYHQYRVGCGRDARLMQIWGKLDAYAPGIEPQASKH